MTLRVSGGRLPTARRLLAGAIVGVVALTGCRPPRPSITPPPPTAIKLDALRKSVDTILADPAIARGTWAIQVTSLAREESLIAINARKLLMPASTMKIVTLAVAADRLGWDYAFRTRLAAVGVIGAGVLKGHLLVIGGGDPTLDDWTGAAAALFDQWANAVKQAGIRQVTGGVIGDDNAFDEDGFGAGWAWDDLGFSYATQVGALQFNENSAQVVATAGTAVGEPAALTFKPASAQLELRGRVTTSAAGTTPLLVIRPTPHAPAIEVRGQVPLGSEAVIRNVAVPNPTIYFATALRDALLRHGIDVQGPPIDIDDLREPLETDTSTSLAESETVLSGFAGTMMTLSQNLFAETLLRALGTRSSAVGTAEAGREAVQKTLESWGIAAQDVLVADGSGLSRYNVITPEALVTVLVHVYNNPRLRDRYLAALPQAGAGTLAARMNNSPAAGNVRAKTGSFSNARALAGFVNTADGEPLAFAILTNNNNADASIVNKTTDDIVATLATFSRR